MSEKLTPAQEQRERTADASFKKVKALRELAVERALSSDAEDRYHARNMGSEISSLHRTAEDNMDAYDKVDATRRDIGDGSNLVENATLAEAMAYATDSSETDAARIRQETLAGLHPDARLNGLDGYNDRPATARTDRVPEIKRAQKRADAITADMQTTIDMVSKY